MVTFWIHTLNITVAHKENTTALGPNGFIAVDFDAEEARSSSRRDAIVTDLTHKEILQPDAPTQTVG
jgi:hypothetical protein